MPGQDIEMLRLPWERGIDKVAKDSLGTQADRDGPQHTGVRGVLFTPGRGLLGRRKYEPPAKHLPVMENNPLLYVSTMETERMALLARERLAQFRGWHERFGEDEEYVFLIKLGYLVDDAEGGSGEREHLWFIVHGLDGDEIDATLATPLQPGDLELPATGLVGHASQGKVPKTSRKSDIVIAPNWGATVTPAKVPLMAAEQARRDAQAADDEDIELEMLDDGFALTYIDPKLVFATGWTSTAARIRSGVLPIPGSVNAARRTNSRSMLECFSSRTTSTLRASWRGHCSSNASSRDCAAG